MRLVATEYVTLDGVFEEPGHWSHPYFNAEAGQYKFEELMAADAQLLGRRTYEGFAAAWPAMEAETGELGVRMNAMPKFVVSSTLTNPTWANTEVLSGDVLASVRELKERPGRDLLLAGSGQLFNALASARLIDEYHFMVHPLVRGHGPRLFVEGGGLGMGLELVRTLPLATGLVILEYRPAPEP